MILKNKKQKILFRVSGGQVKNKQMGLGHVFRSINLAKALKKYAKIYFLIEDYGGVKKILVKHGFKNIFDLKKGLNLELDINMTSQYIIKNKIDVLIIDRYNTKVKYVKDLNKITKTVIISDLKKIDYPANLIVNGFIGFQNKKIKNQYKSNCLIGPAYQILNNQFNKKPITYKKQNTVLATFGGLDEKGIADIFLNSSTKYIKKMKFKLILGPIAKKSNKSHLLGKKNTKSIKIIKETKNMQMEISNSKFGFCGGGVTTYEFASMVYLLQLFVMINTN